MSKKLEKSSCHYVVGRQPPKSLTQKAERQLKYSASSRWKEVFEPSFKLFPSEVNQEGSVVLTLDRPLQPKVSKNAITAREAARFSRKNTAGARLKKSKGTK